MGFCKILYCAILPSGQFGTVAAEHVEGIWKDITTKYLRDHNPRDKEHPTDQSTNFAPKDPLLRLDFNFIGGRPCFAAVVWKICNFCASNNKLHTL